MLRKVPVLAILAVAALQLGAFVKFTKQDSPWRLLGVGIAVLLVLLCMFGYKFFKAEELSKEVPEPSGDTKDEAAAENTTY